MRQHAFLLSALVLAASSPAVLAQSSTLIHCGGGTTSTAGVEINSAGELIFSEESILCGPAGTTLPPPLTLSITSPTQGQEISVQQGPQNVPFSAGLANFTAPYDQCPNLTLTSPAGQASTVPLAIQGAGATAIGTATLSFNSESPQGTYSARLNCARSVEDQQILLTLPSVGFTVTGGGGGESCPTAPTLMQFNITNFSDAAPNGFGIQFGQTTTNGDKLFTVGNLGATTTPLTPPQSLRVRSWRFTAPSGTQSGTVYIGPQTVAAVTAISECPGDFNPTQGCRQNNGNQQLVWTTNQGATGQCVLVPGRQYYLTTAHFSLTNFVSGGVYNNTCGCANPPCSGCVVTYQMNPPP